MKICCICKRDLNVEMFCKNKNTSDKLSAQCKDCAKQYRDANKDKKYKSSSPEYRKAYIEENKDRINESRMIRYYNNPEKYNEQSKKSHFRNRDKRLKAQQDYYEDNKEYFSIKNKIYHEENIDSIYLRARQRKKKITNFPAIKQIEVDNLLNGHDNKCFYCKIDVKRGINLHLDHKIPLARGGEHTINNLVPSCQRCNLKKGIKTAEEFLNRNK